MDKVDLLGERVRSVRDRERLSQTDFGKQFNIGIAKMNRIERGHVNPDAEFLLGLWREFGVDLHWLLTGEQSVESAGNSARMIPQIGATSGEAISGHILVPDAPSGCKAAKIENDDMIPIVRRNDMVLFSLSITEFEHGDLLLIRDPLWDNLMVRRYNEKGEGSLHAEDQDIPPLPMTDDMPIIGKVVKIVRQLTP